MSKRIEKILSDLDRQRRIKKSKCKHKIITARGGLPFHLSFQSIYGELAFPVTSGVTYFFPTSSKNPPTK